MDVYLRTAISVESGGWANYGHVRMPDYRWGIFLAHPEPDRRVNFGMHKGDPAWQEVPGEYRAELRRLIVTQGDTEPASVEQQRLLGQTCPSLYDLRNLFQVNVEEGRHLWAMVYLLHGFFGAGGGSWRAFTSDSKPTCLCLPSQKGLFSEAPQRHSEITVRPRMSKRSPSAS